MTATKHISKLHLFAKDTDAPDVIKGFKYQELKTLEVWLHNKVRGIDEHVYCDFEDDIFQRDLTAFKSTFKQLKLYSSKNFSFLSEEVTKTISHFFMLYVKGDYLMDETLFVFETNTSIARKKGDNDAELLLEWFSNQDKLSDELVSKCAVKLKSIVDIYITEQYDKIETYGKNDELLIAKETYDTLPTEIWEEFTKSIKWIFEGVSSDAAIESSVQNSFSLISQLPFPISKEEYSLVFDRLRGVVSDKSIESNPHDRLLTNNLLDCELLNLGSKDDKIYLESYQVWRDVKELQIFLIGEFYQVLTAAKHCRRSQYVEKHGDLWGGLLRKYITHADTLRKLKREAIYEIIWLKIRPVIGEAPKNSLKGLEDLVVDYFSDCSEFNDLRSLEDALNLLPVLATYQKADLIDIEGNQIIEWFTLLDSQIVVLKLEAPDRNIYCSLLEMEAFSYLNKNSIGIGVDNYQKAFICFNEIIPELTNAPQYAISQLGRRVDSLIKLYVGVGIEDEVEDLEKYSEDILTSVQKREGDFSAAKRYAEKGMDYLNSENPKGILKALDYFHKAKDLYQNDAVDEGFVLAILSISQLYSAIGMNMAAKYYSMSAIWYCYQKEDPRLFKRIIEGYSLLFHYDYKQGSWISSLQVFENYIAAKSTFGLGDFDLEQDELLSKIIVEVSFILGAIPTISNQLGGFVENEKNKMGAFYTDFIKDGLEVIEQSIKAIGVNDLVNRKLDNAPINDLGQKRTITWKADGTVWNVVFQNDYISNSVGEEYTSLIQIIQTEIAIRDIDFCTTAGQIKINIVLVDEPKEPEQLPSNSEYLWKVFLPVLNSKDAKAKNMHYAAITASFQMIYREFSLLTYDDFQAKFKSLFEMGLANRTLTINAYQRSYRDVFPENKFNDSMRDKFEPELLGVEQVELKLFCAKTNISDLYNKEKAIKNIEGRYKNCIKSIHLTILRLNKSEVFKAKLNLLRKEGWLDWQILLAVYSNINDLKAKNLLGKNGKTYTDEDEKEWLEDYQKIYHDIRLKDENETFVEIPITVIVGESLNIQLQQLSINVLASFGLENKSLFPNFQAVREILSKRFNFEVDEVVKLTPFK